MPARDRGKLPAIALAVALTLGLMGTALADHSTDSEIITTGHTTFVSASTTANECFAGITGILMQRVTWFNGQNLFSRPVDGDGDTYLYVMEHFNSVGEGGRDNETGIKPFDPSQEDTLFETGNEWHIEDPNNDFFSEDKTWVVKEYYALKDNGNTPGDLKVGQGDENYVPGEQKKVYIYVVAVGDTREDQQIHREYNFITTANTCKFLHTGGDTQHNNQSSPEDGNPRNPEYQHSEGADPGSHEHGVFHVDLFVGGKPDSVPAPEGSAGGNSSDDGGDGTDGGGDSS